MDEREVARWASWRGGFAVARWVAMKVCWRADLRDATRAGKRVEMMVATLARTTAAMTGEGDFSLAGQSVVMSAARTVDQKARLRVGLKVCATGW